MNTPDYLQPVLATLAQAAQPPAPTPAQREALAKGSLLAMMLLLAITALVVGAVLMRWFMMRANTRREPVKQPGGTPQPPDAWSEAGRRARAPDVSDLEETKVGSAVDEGEPVAPLALVTGGAKRLGRAIVLELAREGCDVIITYHASREEAHEVGREVARLGRRATLYEVDLENAQEVNDLIERVRRTHRTLDVLVHNAATYAPTEADDEGMIDAEEAMRHLRVNALAPLQLSMGLAPLLRGSRLRGGGAIVAMGDIHAMGSVRARHSAYTMSKAALHAMVQSLARDLAPGVRVNAVALGVALWPEAGEESRQSAQERYLRRVPLGRAGTPEEVARTCRWLAIEASYCTGAIVRVDGGAGG